MEMAGAQTILRIANRTLFAGKMTSSQSEGIMVTLNEWAFRKLTDLRWLAYMLATKKWETSHTMQPVREAYWMSEAWRKENLRYWPFYGRGDVQLTWESNYIKMTRLLKARFEAKYPGFDLAKTPDLALQTDVATAIMFEGMMRADSNVGDFTGACLEQFFTPTLTDWVHARSIINGTDKQNEIANIAILWYAALQGQDSTPLALLHYGSSGPEVTEVQRKLKALGYYRLDLDEDYGTGTFLAVKEFQRAVGLKPIDGVVGNDTRKALFAVN